MRDSDFSLGSHEVFHCDVLSGAPNDNDKDLLVHLKTLRKEAFKDGDVVFTLPNSIRIWAHSPLFYIAAGNKLPTEFGTPRRLDPGSDIVETARNGSGIDVTVLYVSEADQPAFEEAMNSCYDISSLQGIWEAMGYDTVDFKGKELDMGVPLDPKLPTSLLPDFEIHLKALGGGPSLCAVKVHKFLLARRIPYYETFFNSGFADASGFTSIVYTEDFSVFALWTVAGFVYHQKLSTMFAPYPDLTDYINPNKPPCCVSFGTDRPIPDISTADKLLEVVRAAHYLQTTSLENWAHFLLCELGHRFKCSGRGCSMFVPHILNLVANCEIADRWVLKKGIHLLAHHRNISAMWKRPLLNCTSSVLGILIAEIKVNSEREGEEGRAVQLFVRLSNLRRHTLASKNPNDWDKKLLVPLMDHTAEVIARRFDSPDITHGLSALFRGLNFSRPIAEELLARIVCSKMLRECNCRQIFVGIMALAKSCGSTTPEVEQAKAECISWFKRKWVTLALSPNLKVPEQPASGIGSRNNQESEDQGGSIEISAPLSTHRRGPPLASLDTGKPLEATKGNKGNFFSTWNKDEIEELAKELQASISDLVATNYCGGSSADDRYKPVRTARGGGPSAGRGVRRGTGSRRGVSASASRIVTDIRPDIRPNMRQQ